MFMGIKPSEISAPCLFADNRSILLQGMNVLAGLPPDIYTIVDPRCLGGSIGGHVRHCVEFYRCFLDGMDTGYLDYDVRARERRLETDAVAASLAIGLTIQRLDSAAPRKDEDRMLHVIENHEDGEPSWSVSSVSRELRFLLSHTVHHYALIAILLRMRGRVTPPDFGIAPSTLRHRARQNPHLSCAR